MQDTTRAPIGDRDHTPMRAGGLVIDLDYFKERRPAVEEILAVIAAQVTQQCGAKASLRLLPSLDVATRERVLALGGEVFGPGGEVFDRRALDEVAADPDALFVVLEIDGSIEGLCFGYYEEEGAEMVDGTDFFIDSGLIAPRWQRRGICWMAGAATLLLVTQLEDVHRVGIAVWSGGDVERLKSIYHQLGFVHATSRRLSYTCLAVDLVPGRVNGWLELLGLPQPVPGDPVAGAERRARSDR